MTPQLTWSDRVDQKLFDVIYARSLVYNTCWEDPAVDRRALALSSADTLLAITSAGCNVLDYALLGPRRIYAVDANPRQTALLELKIAGIRHLSHADFFAVFGRGRHPHFAELYREVLRAELAPFARQYWDRRLDWFSGRLGGFYFHGLAGTVARGFRAYLRIHRQLARHVVALFDAPTLAVQRTLYEQEISPRIWNPAVNWALSRPLTLSMLGVPHPQREEVVAQHRGGVPGFIRESLEYLAQHLPFRDNYFFRIYVCGEYTESCCPEYLKAAQFATLKAGLVDRIEVQTCTITDFLARGDDAISRFVLLDHMDWMSSYHPAALAEEWQAIMRRAAPQARVIFRSAHAQRRYLERLEIGPARRLLVDCLQFHDELARSLTTQDRVHTYAGFHIADFIGARGLDDARA